MREIKFRAWDTVGNQWLWITGFETAETSKSDGYTLDGIFHNGDYVGKEGIVLMQYTGLKDRHGQEIYEGDILRDDEMGLNVVRWEDGSFWLEMFYEGGQSLMEHLSDYNEVCEVIGNIYEHPHLLKGEEKE